MAEPLLDIQTLAARPVIKIDGQLYEILSLDELSVVDSVRFQGWGKRLAALIAEPSLDDAQAEELVAALYHLTDRIMVGVPREVLDELSDASRIAVAEVFMRRLRRDKPARKAKTAKRSRSTGAKRPRDSNASTAAIPPDG